MRFCPKCGALMVPVKKEGETVFECRQCGYTAKVAAKDVAEYKMREEISEKSRVKTTSVVSKPVELAVSAEEKQQKLEEFYEVALELIQEELEGKEAEE